MLKNTPNDGLADRPSHDVTNTAYAFQQPIDLVKAGALQDAIFNSAYFSCIATDEKGVIQIFNVGAERMLGYTATEVVNKVTPADISDSQEVISRAIALSTEFKVLINPGFEALIFKASRGIEDIYELTYVRKDGSRFPAIVSVTVLRDTQEKIIGYLLIGTDNSARQKVEMARELLDQRFRDQQFYTRSLIESNIDALMMTNAQGIISDVNEQMITLTGRTRDELIGAHSRNFFTDPGLADAAIKRVLAEKKMIDYELTVIALNGIETTVSFNAATFYDRDRNLQGVFAAARDVTERKIIERALQEKNIELEHASLMKTEFLATMSHELRTPLNAIVGFSEALKDGLIGELSETQVEFMTDIYTAGHHLLSLINDILDLSKIEAGMMSLELEETDMSSLFANSLSIVKEKAAARQIHLKLDFGDDLGSPLLDMRKTKQIVYNLLSNAVKFCHTDGNVSLKVRRVSRDCVGIQDGNWPVHSFPFDDSIFDEFLEISVVDDGIGISSANMANLFQAFYQIDSRLARKFEGTGLGLATVKQLAELHGGTVAVASAEGEGAKFTAWLPIRTSMLNKSSFEPGDTTEAFSFNRAKERIALVIEDDAKAADLIRLLLESEGFDVVLAASAEEALLLAPNLSPSLITLDILLPGIDGWGFLQALREYSSLACVPVVVIASDVDKNMALTRGAAAVLQKPISRAQLKSSLDYLGLQPVEKHTHTVLVVDDDPKAVEVIVAFLQNPSYAVVRAYGGNEAIMLAHRTLPDLIVLDLMMPEVNGFDVVKALLRNPATAQIPILVVTAKQVSEQDRDLLNINPGNLINIIEKSKFNHAHFLAEVKRALKTI